MFQKLLRPHSSHVRAKPSYYLQKFLPQAPYTSLRLSNAIGAPAFANSDCWWLVLNDLCLSAVRNKKLILKSDGLADRDFLHIENVGNIISGLARENIDNGYQTYNLCTGANITIKNLAVRVAEIAKEKFNIDAPVFGPNGLIEHSEVNAQSTPLYTPSPHLAAYHDPTLTIDDAISEVFHFVINNNPQIPS